MVADLAREERSGAVRRIVGGSSPIGASSARAVVLLAMKLRSSSACPGLRGGGNDGGTGSVPDLTADEPDERP